tara:strand:- start:58 stop:570 length:513 start_codon:yes stop_codon:yes gene_type:complete
MQRGERWKNKFQNNFNKGNRDKLELQQISDEAKMLFYQTEKLSPEIAFIYQTSLPLPFVNLGYAYSDNWKRGAWFDVLILTEIIISESLTDDSWDCEIDDECDGDEDMSDLFGLLAVGTFIFKHIDVYQQAEKYNDQLFKRVFKRKRPSFAFDYSLNNKTTELTISYPLN